LRGRAHAPAALLAGGHRPVAERERHVAGGQGVGRGVAAGVALYEQRIPVGVLAIGRRGHHYASLFCDLGRSKLLFATKGKDAATFQRFQEDLVAHGGDPDEVTHSALLTRAKC
jgi:hypothetical protein